MQHPLTLSVYGPLRGDRLVVVAAAAAAAVALLLILFLLLLSVLLLACIVGHRVGPGTKGRGESLG